MKQGLVFLLNFIGLFCQAQTPEWFTDRVKGKPLIIRGTNKVQPGTALKQGEFIYKDDVIAVEDNETQITLVNKEGRYLVLDKKGKYQALLLQPNSRKPSGITKKYFQLVWEELSNSSGEVKSGIDNMVKSWGGVSRGNCVQTWTPAPNVVTGADSIIFSWKPVDPNESYSFSFANSEKQPFYNLVIRDTLVVVKKLPNSEGELLLWSLNRVNAPCNTPQWQALTWLQKEKYDSEVARAIGNDVPESTFGYLQAADRLLQANLLDMAETYLKKAHEIKNGTIEK